MTIPIYHDGKPANLQAAILDAEFWLRWLRNRLNGPQPPSKEWNEYRHYLHLAIETLTEFLPDEGLTPVQQAKFDLIKAQLRAKQQAMKPVLSRVLSSSKGSIEGAKK